MSSSKATGLVNLASRHPLLTLLPKSINERGQRCLVGTSRCYLDGSTIEKANR